MAPLVALAFKLLPFVSAVPEVVEALRGGNATEAAGKVLDVAKRIAGVDDPEAAAQAIINKPELQLQLQQALIAERVEYAKLASAERVAQIEVNKQDATSTDKFQSRWRPFIGWVCGVAFAYASIVDPLMRFVAQVGFGYIGVFPTIDTMLTLQVLFGLLGLAGLRTHEKTKGRA